MAIRDLILRGDLLRIQGHIGAGISQGWASVTDKRIGEIVNKVCNAVGSCTAADRRNLRTLTERSAQSIGRASWMERNPDRLPAAGSIPTLPGSTRAEQRTYEYEVLVQVVDRRSGQMTDSMVTVKSDRPLTASMAQARAIGQMRQGDIRPERTTGGYKLGDNGAFSARVMSVFKGSFNG